MKTCQFCSPQNPCPDCLEEYVRSCPELQLQPVASSQERFFVVADKFDPGVEVESFDAASAEVNRLRTGNNDPRIIFLN